MRYGIITIDAGSVNLGNRLIEYAIKSVLKMSEPSVSVSMFKCPTKADIAALNTCDFVLLPGSTILAYAKGNSDALKSLKYIRVPVYCVAASGWGPRFPYYIDAIKNITPPIGCRDPETLGVCKSLGIPAILTGCPTAYLQKHITTPKTPYIILGFGRDLVETQVKLLNCIVGKRVAAIQERKFELPIAKKLQSDVFYYTNPIDVMRHYGEASAVVTGRLHGLLPALSQDKPVMFFGNKNDSRFTLLKYLNIKIHDIKSIKHIKFQKSTTYKSRVEELKHNFLSWSESVGIT